MLKITGFVAVLAAALGAADLYRHGALSNAEAVIIGAFLLACIAYLVQKTFFPKRTAG
jgi:hypothetical protein